MTLVDELKKERIKQLDEVQRINEIISHLEELLKLLGEPVPPPAMTIDDHVREENKMFGGERPSTIEDSIGRLWVLEAWELDSFLKKYDFAREPGQTDEEYRTAFNNYVNSNTPKVLRPSRTPGNLCQLCYTFDAHQPGCPGVELRDRAVKKIEEIVTKDIMSPYDKNDTRDTPISSVVNDEI